MAQIHICSGCREPILDPPTPDRANRPVRPHSWRHLDGGLLCPDAVPVAVDEAPTDPQADQLLDPLRDLFATAGPHPPARTATALTVLSTVSAWLQTATRPPRGPANVTTDGGDRTRILHHLYLAVRAHTVVLHNLADDVDVPAPPATGGQLLDRLGPRIRHTTNLLAAAAVDLATVWGLQRHADTDQRAGACAGCGCSRRCAGCDAVPAAPHGPHCTWQYLLAPTAPAAAFAANIVQDYQIHRSGCPHAVVPAGGLFIYDGDSDLRCLVCNASNTRYTTMDVAADGRGVEVEGCEACGARLADPHGQRL